MTGAANAGRSHASHPLETGSGTGNVDSAVRAIEQVFFELIELVGVHLVQQVPFGCLQTHCVLVVHGHYSPSYQVVNVKPESFQGALAAETPGGRFSMFLK